MMAELKPYPKMKDSGVEWLGMVPEHWDIRRAKYLFNSIDVRSENGDEELLTVSSHDGVVPRSEKTVTMFQAASYVGHKLCWPGDLVINSLWAWANGLGFSRYHGIVSTAYGVYRLRPECNASYEYFNLALRSGAYDWEFQTRSKGIWKSRLQLTDWSFLDMPLIIPPLPEQVAIARYLDYVDSRVRRLTEAKRKLIGLLTEQKQAIIHRAVTRGLDPNVPLKDSGIEWLGMVPQHWEIEQLGRIGVFSKGSGGTKEDETTEGVSCIRYGDLYTKYDLFVDNVKSYISEDKAVNYTPIQYGDVLFAGSGETIEEIGKSAVNLLHDSVYCAGDVIIFRPSIKLNAKFFGFATGCPYARYQKSCMGRGITIMHIYARELKYLTVALPPISEQVAIVEYLDRVTAKIDIAVAGAERQIELLNEYRTRLIADVVTGKLDVRDATPPRPPQS